MVATRRMVSARRRSTPESMPRGRRDGSQSGRRGRHEEVGRSRGALAELGDEPGPRAPRLASGHLLFEDGRHERVEHPLGPAQPHARHADGPASPLPDAATGSNPSSESSAPHIPGRTLEQPAGTRSPCSSDDGSSPVRDREIDGGRHHRAYASRARCRRRVADGRVGATVTYERHVRRRSARWSSSNRVTAPPRPCIEAAGRRCT